MPTVICHQRPKTLKFHKKKFLLFSSLSCVELKDLAMTGTPADDEVNGHEIAHSAGVGRGNVRVGRGDLDGQSDCPKRKKGRGKYYLPAIRRI